MFDFMSIKIRPVRGTAYVEPVFTVMDTQDLMIRGGRFYAIWDEESGFWSTSEFRAIELMDKYLREAARHYEDVTYIPINRSDSKGLMDWKSFTTKLSPDKYHTLDSKIIFADTVTKKEDYASKRLNYSPSATPTPAYNKLMSVLYSPEERNKIEWSIGAVLSGDSDRVQKFMVLYGPPGSGKSTILNIMEKLFGSYCVAFDAASIGMMSSSFAMEQFRTNPLVAIQQDGDLSKIESNARLNTIISHETVTINEKHKSAYTMKLKTFLFLGTNKPVKITDAKSGLLRRLIVATPTGNKIPNSEYLSLIRRVDFEYGGIAKRCLDIYNSDPHMYDNYIPVDMLAATNDIFNFIAENAEVFKREKYITLKTIWAMYKEYADESRVRTLYSMRDLRTELINYFDNYYQTFTDPETGKRLTSVFSDFNDEKFHMGYESLIRRGESLNPGTLKKYNEYKRNEEIYNNLPDWIKLSEYTADKGNAFQIKFIESRAQYSTDRGTPRRKWVDTKGTLAQIDPTIEHYVKLPENVICIDFDLKDEYGNKKLYLNLEAASHYPPTYAETSRSGQGIHLYYIYDGDPSKLAQAIGEHVEIKTCLGGQAIRRKLILCNDLDISTISSGLPLSDKTGRIRGTERMLNGQTFANEKALRTMLINSIQRKYHPNTKPSVDWIKKFMDIAYTTGMKYDVTDLRRAVYDFASKSTNNADYCTALVEQIHWRSDEPSENESDTPAYVEDTKEEKEIIFFDVEVFPNLFIICWKKKGSGYDKLKVVKMINPTQSAVSSFVCTFKNALVGFNNREYDNHILYAAMLGYTNEQLFNLSKNLISNDKKQRKYYKVKFNEATNLSYTDIYDFAATKQSLKKWEIELGIHHQEAGLPWDQDVPYDRWDDMADYCANDVVATEQLFDHLKDDFLARQILADIAGMTVNDTTNTLTTRIIFGKERKPNLVYTHLDTGEQEGAIEPAKYPNAFPGYEHKLGEDGKMHNMYHDVDLGYGGYVLSVPGIYHNVVLLDVESLHPASAIAMNYFGKYTERFWELREARVLIKHGDYISAGKMFDGKLSKYLQGENAKESAAALAYALKIAINSVYGLTSATFENPFRDKKNTNNIVALRGALFMRSLYEELVARGFNPIHIKTDSIKIPDATPEIVQFVMEYAAKYGYKFDHEATYEKICLIDKANYIAKYSSDPNGGSKQKPGKWTATGDAFKRPYIFKTLFSGEPVEFNDYCETKSVKTAIYLDLNEDLVDTTPEEKEYAKLEKALDKAELDADKIDIQNRMNNLMAFIAKGHSYRFIGKVSSFVPIAPGYGGGLLVKPKEIGVDKYDAVTGTKGFRWLEAEAVRGTDYEQHIDQLYFDQMVNDAKAQIAKFGDADEFIS